MGPTVLFVYGTLKRGRANHRLLGDSRYLGPATTEPRYRLIDLGPYPALVRDDDHGLAVHGEVWEVSAARVAILDEFEGVPDLYERAAVEVIGREGDVQAYFWNRPVPHGRPSGAVWPFEGG